MNQAIAADQLLAELDLGSARGGKAGINGKGEPLIVSIARPLVESDLAAIANPPAVCQPPGTIKSLRHSHHRLAQLVAQGKPGAEISIATGYSLSYISTLQSDPAFAELVTYYAEQNKTIFADVQERLRVLGLDATEKLHEQLHDETIPWSKRDLMEVISMTIANKNAPGQGNQQQPGNAGNTSLALTVKFVGAQPTSAPLIEGSATLVEEQN